MNLRKIGTLILIAALWSVNIPAEAQSRDSKKKIAPINWHMLDASENLHGASVEQAYEYIKEKNLTPKKKIVVAVIGSGVDVEHEDLKDVMWVNSKEIPNNGIDDDKNGYVDDIHGWNFLGNEKGEILYESSLEGDREFVRLIDKFQVYGIDSTLVPSKEMDEYRYFRNLVIKNSKIGKAYESFCGMQSIAAYADTFSLEMQSRFEQTNNDFTIDQFKQIAPGDNDAVEAQRAFIYYGMVFSRDVNMKGKQNVHWKDIIKSRYSLVDKAEVNYKVLLAEGLKDRSLIGDNPNSIKDKCYGNNAIITNSSHETHVAGIIGANRNNELGINGIADVQIMTIRAVPNGDEYDKDVALAIEYAVNNGADIINISFGKVISTQKKWVDKALLKAQKKGVLVVHAAGNSASDVDAHMVYPSRHVGAKKELNNFIRVGSIDFEGQPAGSSSYGKTEVEVFAPGVNIYSSIPGNNYQKMSGTSSAAPVVSGVAALVWSYFPNLTVPELISVLKEGVVDLNNLEVNKPRNVAAGEALKSITFGELCAWQGVINAYNAVKIANER